jgi:hypothetical protein
LSNVVGVLNNIKSEVVLEAVVVVVRLVGEFGDQHEEFAVVEVVLPRNGDIELAREHNGTYLHLYDLCRYASDTSDAGQAIRLLDDVEHDLVLHVGASVAVQTVKR